VKAAVVKESGQLPGYGDFPEPKAPAGQEIVTVRAAAIRHGTRGRASGRHYSMAKDFSFVPGVDRTGVTPAGQRVYFLLPERPYGALAQRCLVDAGE